MPRQILAKIIIYDMTSANLDRKRTAWKSQTSKILLNVTSMGSYFGMPTFYIDVCYCYLNQYGSY